MESVPPARPGGMRNSMGVRRSPGLGSSTPVYSAPGPAENREPGPLRVTVRPGLLAMLRICVDACVSGVSPANTRILVLLRDVSPTPTPLNSSIRSAVEAVLGPALSGFCCVEKLTGIAGAGRRQRALAAVRSQLQRELGALGETSATVPCLETLRSIFGHFRDCFDHTIDRPVQLCGGIELQPEGRIGMVLASLLDSAEAQAASNLRAVVFPVSEAASEFAMLKAKEKRLLEDSDGATPDDAQIAELSSQLRALESSRRALLSQPVTPLVRFFVEATLLDLCTSKGMF